MNAIEKFGKPKFEGQTAEWRWDYRGDNLVSGAEFWEVKSMRWVKVQTIDPTCPDEVEG